MGRHIMTLEQREKEYPEVYARMQRVVELRKLGMTFKEIGQELNIGVERARQLWHKMDWLLRAEIWPSIPL